MNTSKEEQQLMLIKVTAVKLPNEIKMRMKKDCRNLNDKHVKVFMHNRKPKLSRFYAKVFISLFLFTQELQNFLRN